MREIKFRGKVDHSYDRSDGQWVYGYLFRFQNNYVIAEDLYVDDDGVDEGDHIIDEKTIGQFTGLYDKNGKETYEGDLFKRNTHYGVVQYLNNKFVIVFDDNRVIDLYEDECQAWNYKDYEIIGNIHDNPELLKEQ